MTPLDNIKQALEDCLDFIEALQAMGNFTGLNFDKQKQALKSIEELEKTHVFVPREPTDAIGKVSGMQHECACGVRFTLWGVNKWSEMLKASEEE